MSNQSQHINPPESSTANYHIPGALPTECKNRTDQPDTNQSETDSPNQRDLPSPTPDDSQSQASGSRWGLGSGLAKGFGSVKQAVTGSNAGSASSNKNKDYEAGLKDLDNLKLSDEDVDARRESLAPGESVAVDDKRDTLDKPTSPPPSASQATPVASNADPIGEEGEQNDNTSADPTGEEAEQNDDTSADPTGEEAEQNDETPAEPQQVDLSILNGLTPNKTGVVIGPDGFPVGRVVEGNPRELAGRAIDGEDGCIYDGKRVLGRVEAIPEDQRETKHEGPFAGLEGLVVGDNGLVQDVRGMVVGRIVEGDASALRGRAVDDDGDIVDRFGTSKGRAEPYQEEEEEEPQPEEQDLSILEGKTVNKAGNVVDEHGTVVGRIVSGDGRRLAGRRVDGQGQVWGDSGNVIGRAELIPGAEQERPEGPFFGFEGATVGAEGVVADSTGQVIGRVVEGDAARLLGRPVDEDGDILDKNGNGIGRAERWQPESKPRNVSPMAGRKVTREGEVRDTDGNLIGKLTAGNLATLVGREIDDNGYVVDNDGNRLGECTLLENIPEPEPEPEPEGPTEAEKEEQRKAEEDRQLAQKMSTIVSQALDRMRPICKMISEHVDKADRTPREELDEEALVQQVKPLLEEGGNILQECNGAVRALDPDGRIAATAKARAASHEATPAEYALADQLKELTDTVVQTIDNGKKRIADMPHAKKELNPLWGLLSEPLFQIIAAVGLLLTGVLGLVGRLLEGLGLGPLVHGLLGGLGIDRLLGSLGLGGLTDALGMKS